MKPVRAKCPISLFCFFPAFPSKRDNIYFHMHKLIIFDIQNFSFWPFARATTPSPPKRQAHEQLRMSMKDSWKREW